jgi:hypothetical protein
MFGHGRAWPRGRWWRQPPVATPEAYTYVGPCRCGFGPDAFYQDKGGRIVHAHQVYRWGVPRTPRGENLETEVNWLREEKAELEGRIKELEERLKKEG